MNSVFVCSLFKIQKPLKRNVSRVLMWAQMDSNHRPSDYESDAPTPSSPDKSGYAGQAFELSARKFAYKFNG